MNLREIVPCAAVGVAAAAAGMTWPAVITAGVVIGVIALTLTPQAREWRARPRRIRTSGAYVIRSAESRPRPIVPRDRPSDHPPPAATASGTRLIKAIRKAKGQ